MKYLMEMEVDLEDLAEFFEKQGWMYATHGCYGIPNVTDLSSQIWRLLHTIEEHDYVRSGRFVLIRDEEFPDSFEVLLSVGYLSPDGDFAIAGEEIE